MAGKIREMIADRIPLSTKEGIMILGWMAAGGVAYGVMTTKLSAQEERIKELAPAKEQLVVLKERVDSIDKRTESTDRLVREIWNFLLTNKR